MNKLKLSLDQLTVETFPTTRALSDEELNRCDPSDSGKCCATGGECNG